MQRLRSKPRTPGHERNADLRQLGLKCGRWCLYLHNAPNWVSPRTRATFYFRTRLPFGLHPSAEAVPRIGWRAE